MLMEGRFFHGIVTYMSSPLERHYFILDSKRATLSVFHTLKQKKADNLIIVAQCLMSF